MTRLLTLILLALLLAACGQVQLNVVPTTGDTAFDAASAQSQIPNFSNYGYSNIDASSITDAIGGLGGSAALVSGNPAAAAAILKIDDMIQCYESVGAIAAAVYAQADVAQLLEGQLPKAGAVAIVNRDRLAGNLLPCALNTGQGMRAMSAQIEPCAGAGTFVRQGATFDYVYAATDPELCNLFAAALA
jgi:hypothetical protein